jgi:hypothetical protein
MTKRNNVLERRSYDNLLYAAGDCMFKDAIAALGDYQKIREAGGIPEVWYSQFHGWVVKDGRLPN